MNCSTEAFGFSASLSVLGWKAKESSRSIPGSLEKVLQRDVIYGEVTHKFLGITSSPPLSFKYLGKKASEIISGGLI